MITNSKYAQKLLASQDKRRALTVDEKMLETALLQASVLSAGSGENDEAFAALKQHMEEHAPLFWDYLNFAVVATADSFGVRPGTWLTRTPEELSSILVPLSATPDQSRDIRTVIDAVSVALNEREGQASEEFLTDPDGALMLKMGRMVAVLAVSRAKHPRLAPALIVKGIRRITDEYHKSSTR
ncbi:hypothetical protein [Arthrobacter sp. IK3]|uniref:hypothetical protein n=1 Tax=Arthrobacter sp. IK3 TaxID=3448169 RepID=UPI003EE3A118